MASLSISNVMPESATWIISGLNYPFNTDYYIEAGVSTQPAGDDSEDPPSGIFQYTTDAPAPGDESDPNGSLINLSPDTTYSVVYGYVQTASGLYYTAGSDSFTTPPAVPSTPDNPTVDSTSTNSITWKWTNPDYADSYDWETTDGQGDTAYNGTSKEVSFSSDNTSYGFRVKARNDEGTSNWTDYVYGTTDLAPPSGFSATGVSVDSISLSWNSKSGADNYRWWWKKSVDSWPSSYTDGVDSDSGLTTSTTVSGLEQDTSYDFRLRVFDSPETSDWTSTSASTLNTSRPSDWEWSSSELYAFGYNGATTTLTYSRWNDFVDRVEAFVVYYNETYGTSVPSVLSAKMSSSNKILTASKFNTVKFSIGSMNATGISDKSSGDIVYGWYFTRLSDRLNEIT